MELNHGYAQYDDPTLPHFDQYQFRTRSKAITPDSHITFNDYNRMHVQGHSTWRRRRWCPEFASNMEQLRKVLTQAIWQSRHAGNQMPENLHNDLEALKRLASPNGRREAFWMRQANNEALTMDQRIRSRRHIYNLDMAGSLLHMLARIVYLSWHLGYTSVDVAREMNIRPPNVRVIKWRLCEVARKLGFETFKRIHTAGRTGNARFGRVGEYERKRARCKVYEARYRQKKKDRNR